MKMQADDLKTNKQARKQQKQTHAIHLQFQAIINEILRF